MQSRCRDRLRASAFFIHLQAEYNKTDNNAFYNKTGKTVKRIFLIAIMALTALASAAQTQKVQRNPYIDQRKIHYGFFFGGHVQDMKIRNNGFVTADGESWFADVDEYMPGFEVGVLTEFYLHQYFALRVIPSLYFGDRKVVFKEQNTNKDRTYMDMKTCYISLPVALKFSAERVNNYRPYITAGVSPLVNLMIKKQKHLLIKPFDFQLEVGMGCDIYLKYFKLIPELKFSFGLLDIIEKTRNDLTDKNLMKYTQSVDRATTRSISLIFYFE